MSERAALLSILASVLLFSLFPVFNAFSVGSIEPFTYVAKASIIAGLIDIVIYFGFRQKRESEPIWGVLKRAKAGWVILSSLLAVLAYGTVVRAFYLASNTAVTITYELWPIFVLFLFPLVHRGRFSELSKLDFFAILQAIMGVSFVIFSTDGIESFYYISLSYSDEFSGVLLALLSAVVMAIAVICKSKAMFYFDLDKTSFSSFTAMEIVNRFSGALIASIFAILLGEDFANNLLQWDSSFGFGVVEGIGGLLYWVAVSKSRRSTIQLLLYLSPLLAFFWLYLLGRAELSAMVLFGAMMIFSANVLAHYDRDRSSAFSMTVFFAICSCVYCYYTRGSADVNAFVLLGIPTTLFAILIGFMLERVSSKRREQQKFALELLMTEKSMLTNCERDTFNSSIISSFEGTFWNRGAQNAEALNVIFKKLDKVEQLVFERFMLARVNPLLAGEVMVLTLVGLSSIFASHIVRPLHFFGDFFPVVLTATVTYLCLSVIEQKDYAVRDTLSGIVQRAGSKTIKQAGSPNELVAVGLIMLITILVVFLTTLMEKYGLIYF